MKRTGPESRRLSAQTPMRLGRTTDDENARSALECGSSSYRLSSSAPSTFAV